MKVFTKGAGEVQLTQNNFVAAGGEGKVFAIGGTGYKIYHDPGHVMPAAKIQELAGIQHPDVIRPLEPLYSTSRGNPHVGHTFRFCPSTWSLCQLFPPAFRDREGLKPDAVVELVQKLRGCVEAVHQAGVLIVDLNEMNALVGRDFRSLFCIDVDSYQTPHFPATAIMPSVRDPLVQHNAFTEASDWWSFAVVTFQLFTAIHPFKGKHPTVHGFEERMKRGLSVLDKAVSVPRTCYPWSVIPAGYLAWYRSLFVDGKRSAPPADLHAAPVAVAVGQRLLNSTEHLDVLQISRYPENIRAAFGWWVHAGQHVYHNGKPVWDGATHPIVFGASLRPSTTIASWIEDERLQLRDLMRGESIDITLRADEVMSSDGCIYVRNREQVLMLQVSEAGGRTIAGGQLVGYVLPQASRLYEGCALQNVLGEPHVSLFWRPGSCLQAPLPELKGYKIVQARFEGGVLMVLAGQSGRYDRLIFKFDANAMAMGAAPSHSYTVRVVSDVPLDDLNFRVLSTGVCVCLTEENKLEVFAASKSATTVKVVDDPALGGDMRLVSNGAQLRFTRGDRLYGMKLR